jgi:hypothetical protein
MKGCKAPRIFETRINLLFINYIEGITKTIMSETNFLLFVPSLRLIWRFVAIQGRPSFTTAHMLLAEGLALNTAIRT